MESAAEKYYAFQTTARGLLTKENLEERFSKLALWYGCFLEGNLPRASANAKLLDIPCGSGNLLYFLRRKGYQNLVGVDADPKQVDLALLLDLPAIEGDAFTYLLNKISQHDCIFSLDFLEHLSHDQTVNFLELCFNSLKSGGRLIVRTSCADGLFGAHDRYNDLTHKWGMTSNVLKTLFEMVGYTSVVILDERPQPYNFINRLRLMVYYPTILISSLWLILLGLNPPRIWSNSMWGIGLHP